MPLVKFNSRGRSRSPFVISSIFDDLLNDQSLFPTEGLRHSNANISETDKGYTIDIAAPGLKKEQFNVDLDDQLLTISYENKSKETDNSSKSLRKEFSYSSFKRTFTLPEGVKKEEIKANYADGILSVEVPKSEEALKVSKKIEIS